MPTKCILYPVAKIKKGLLVQSRPVIKYAVLFRIIDSLSFF